MTEETTKTTMRELLAKWAELEPKRCTPSEVESMFFVLVNDIWYEIVPDEISEGDLMYTQWSVQGAIVARGWFFSLEYTDYWVARVNARQGILNRNSGAEALLEAYLKALETNQ